MTISQVISRLAELRAFNGNIEVRVDGNCGGPTFDISEIAVQRGAVVIA